MVPGAPLATLCLSCVSGALLAKAFSMFEPVAVRENSARALGLQRPCAAQYAQKWSEFGEILVLHRIVANL
jgi:hypothetical protein